MWKGGSPLDPPFLSPLHQTEKGPLPASPVIGPVGGSCPHTLTGSLISSASAVWPRERLISCPLSMEINGSLDTKMTPTPLLFDFQVNMLEDCAKDENMWLQRRVF